MKKKKELIYIATILSLILSTSEKREDNIYYCEDDESDVFAYFNKYKVIIDNNINYDYEENVIHVIDNRCEDDSSFGICDSYKIKSRDDKLKVISILEEYEERNPSNWYRSTDSMMNEWYIHDFLYKLNYEKRRSEKVDFNNADEILYKDSEYIENIFKEYIKSKVIDNYDIYDSNHSNDFRNAMSYFVYKYGIDSIARFGLKVLKKIYRLKLKM